MAEMQHSSTDAADSMAYGQTVIVTARWVLIVAGLLFSVWQPNALGPLRVQLGMVLALACANFYLHAQLFMKRPALDRVVYLATAADLGVITLIVLSQGGSASGLYIFYFPAILAFSVAFGMRETFSFTAAAMALYTLVSLASLHPVTEASLQVLLTRLMMMAAVAVCGATYWRIESNRRDASVGRSGWTEARR